MAHDTDKMNQELDAQMLELDKRFNQFLKELEEDFNFVPSAVANHGDDEPFNLDRALKLDHRLEDMEKRYAMVDKRYKVILVLTSSVTIGIFGYLGYQLLGL
jgi:predicted nuclease of restriction endonuclease-like (RecB) superfamily